MNHELSTKALQRSMLFRSIYLLIAPIMFLFAALACGTMIPDLPSYTCPTPTPAVTSTVLPFTPEPTMLPPPTPYMIHSPQDFYVGDAVFVGQRGAARYLRFRLQNVQSQPAPPLNGMHRNLYTWELEISNEGSAAYETIPPALMGITRISTVNGEQTGMWRSTEAAMNAAGFTDENYDPLLPNRTRLYRLAAYGPAGTIEQFAYLLDGESNRITWVNAFNPYCASPVVNEGE
jgi:hypothetical protein